MAPDMRGLFNGLNHQHIIMRAHIRKQGVGIRVKLISEHQKQPRLPVRHASTLLQDPVIAIMKHQGPGYRICREASDLAQIQAMIATIELLKIIDLKPRATPCQQGHTV